MKKHEPYSTCVERPTSMFIVYVLIDPRDGAPRYIGQSSKGLRRPQFHGYPYRLQRYPGHCSNWIRQLQREGLRYQIGILCELSSADHLHDAERFWIAEGRRLGWSLTNATDGGEGTRGYVASDETRAKLSAAKKGRPKSAEHRAKIAEALRGQKHTDERIRNIKAARRPQRLSADHKEKLRLANLGNKYNLGKKASTETRLRQSLAHRKDRTPGSQMELRL